MKRYSEARRIKLVREYENGGHGNAAEFCRRRCISAGSLAKWRCRYGAEVAGKTATPTANERWLPVVLTDAAAAVHDARACYVVTIGARRLEVPRGFDVQEVRLLCELLGLGNEEVGA